MNQYIRVLFLIGSMICGGYMFHKYFTVGFDISLVYASVIFLISSVIAILLPTQFKRENVLKRSSSFLIWFFSMTAVIGTLFFIEKVRNLSPVLFSTSYYWEEGIDVAYRKNSTYRALNSHIFGEDVSYGGYKLQDSMIIHIDKVKLGSSYMNDTLLVTSNGVRFKMEEPWRVDEGVMKFNYGSNAKFNIINETGNTIDSVYVKLHYTKQKSITRKVKSKESIEYIFEMENTHVNGKYIMSYRILNKEEKSFQVKNLTDGFPLESIKNIRLFADHVIIETIFGIKITKRISS